MELKFKDGQQVAINIAGDFSAVQFQVRGFPVHTLEMSKLHECIRHRAACVGMAQVRIVDAAAVTRADKLGNIRSEAEMLRLKDEGIGSLVAHYMSGTDQWALRTASERGEDSITIEALARVKAWDLAKARLHAEERAAERGEEIRGYLAFLRNSGQIRDAINAIKAERAGPNSADADAELANLMAE